MKTPLQIKQNRLMLAARIRFTNKCLVKAAINNAGIGDNLDYSPAKNTQLCLLLPTLNLN